MKKFTCVLFFISIFMGCSLVSRSGDYQADLYLTVGAYTASGGDGLYLYKFDSSTGESEYSSSLEINNPSYLTYANTEDKLYVVTENNDAATDCVSVLNLDKKQGIFNFIESQLTGGAAPCYIVEDSLHQMVVTANYMGGSISVFNLDKNGCLEDRIVIEPVGGKLGPNRKRQEQPHLHCAYLAPDGKYLFANDLGTDCIYQFDLSNLDLEKPTKLIQLSPGCGPRHTVFHPNGLFAYVITELSGEVMCFNYDGESLTQFQTIQADPEQAGGSADIKITPDGKFLYASNRLKNDGVAIFSIDSMGKLTHMGYQKTGIHPRNMEITPDGGLLLVACRDSNCIEIYKIDEKTGLLTHLDRDIKVKMPVCLKFVRLEN